MSYSKLPRGYIAKSTVIVVSLGTVAFTAMQFGSGSERFHKEIFMPAMHRYFDGEKTHRLAVAAAKYGLLPLWGRNYYEYPELNTRVWDIDFRNPIGLAAGFDKDAEAVNGLRRSGFGFIEIGSVTPLPQPGNPRPRVFRLYEDQAVINRYGFNSAGVGTVRSRLKSAFRPSDPVPVGVNLGKNKESTDARLDYEICVGQLGPFCDYLVVNVSSPNTPGLRELQKRGDLEKLLATVKSAIDRLEMDEERRPKLLLKVAPDLNAAERKDIATTCMNKKYRVDGLIVSNTTLGRPAELRSEHAGEAGGLSGAPLKETSTECVRDFYRLTKGGMPIIGCGGVASGKDAYEKIRAGASLVQLYTSLVYGGFLFIVWRHCGAGCGSLTSPIMREYSCFSATDSCRFSASTRLSSFRVG
uniref:Dihydroorotate dehydrogenase (quinone), mitochondrial n=1 Tax=Plectus sambesii TaxID=2011161 RepID=A0A914VX24_9BILA